MSNELRFTFSLDKLINAIAFFASKGIRDLTKLKVAKLLYFADKDHLLQYGRPIIGDEYFCLPYGPVPSVSLNEINDALHSSSLEDDESINADAICFASTLKVHRPFFGHPVFRAKQGYDADVFSKSELNSLNRISERFGSKTASQLVELSHKELAWMLPNKNRPAGGRARIPYELFFHDADAEAQQLLRFIKEEQADNGELDAFMCDNNANWGNQLDAEPSAGRPALQGTL